MHSNPEEGDLMGYVYAGKGENSRHVKIGCTAVDPAKRLAQHRTSNPGFQFYRVIQTAHPYAAEQFLKTRFAERRLANTTEWFAIDKSEVDDGFSALELFMQKHLSISQERTIKDYARQRSNGILLEPKNNQKEIYEKLRNLKSQIDRAKLEFEHWASQLKFQIGVHEGIDGLVSWGSETQHRIDQEMLKTKHPEIWSECRKEFTVRYFRLLDVRDRTDPAELRPRFEGIAIRDLLQSDELLLSVRFHSARRT